MPIGTRLARSLYGIRPAELVNAVLAVCDDFPLAVKGLAGERAVGLDGFAVQPPDFPLGFLDFFFLGQDVHIVLGGVGQTLGGAGGGVGGIGGFVQKIIKFPGNTPFYSSVDSVCSSVRSGSCDTSAWAATRQTKRLSGSGLRIAITISPTAPTTHIPMLST